jgi:hypothetical protein
MTGSGDSALTCLMPALLGERLTGSETRIAAASPWPKRCSAQAMLEEGRRTFRYDTFGSEAFWGEKLELHEAIAGEKRGGVGPGVSPIEGRVARTKKCLQERNPIMESATFRKWLADRRAAQNLHAFH